MTKSWLKKLSAMLALCLMLGSFSGCKGDEGSSTAEGTAETGDSTAEAEEEIIKIGYVFNGSCDVDSYSAQANAQRIAASEYTTIESCYIDNVNITDLSTAVGALIDDGCSYIISDSWLFNNALSDVAGKNMDVNFISHGARIRSVNVYAYTDRVYEGAYVAGMVAAFNSEAEKIGIVVDPDMLYTKPVINAAALGSQLVYNDATLVTAFATTNNEIHSAVDALDAEGCDVIISYTGSAETVPYCNEKGIKVIGNLDYSETAENYDNLLMYFHIDHNSFFLAQNKLIQLDIWEPEQYVGTLANGVVSVSEALPAAADGTQDIINALVPKISSGEAYIFRGELKNNSGNVALQKGGMLDETEVYTMDWYVLGVQTLPTFIEPHLELENNEMQIKY